MYDDDDGERGSDSDGAEDATMSMRDKLDAYVGRVNPRPVEHWGRERDPAYAMLCDAFKGRTNLVMKTRTEEYRDQYNKKRTRDVEYTALANVCAAHAKIAANPGGYAYACDRRTGVRCVHACAFNGYARTLAVLIDAGGADAYAKTTCGVDAFEIAASRKHADVELVLAGVEEKRLALEEKLRRAPLDLEEAARRAEEAEARAKKFEEQNRVEEAKRRMLEEEARRARQRAAEERAWKRLGIVPTRRMLWKGIQVDIDERRGVGYFPKILREIPKARPIAGAASAAPRTLG